MRFTLLSAILLTTFIFCTQKTTPPAVDWDQLDEAARRKPENALAGMTVPEGLEVTLFASEPMLVNPTNIQVDERGRVWVCEALNYRNAYNPENPNRPEGDRILILEDTDGDGKADKNTVFYQGNDVNAALGIWAVGNRAIVSCSPNVFILTDTDGDNKADKKDTLFSNVGGLQTDHAIHAFAPGPDGKFYFNFGNTGKHLSDAHGQPVREQNDLLVNDAGTPYRQGMVFRCNPDGSGVEVLAHNFRNNYEVAADSYGALWQSDNDDDGNKGVRINYVMDYGNFGYTDEMTGAGWQTPRTGLESDIPHRHWHQNDPGVVPNLLFTGSGSPCGITVYEGELLPKPFQNQMIHCEAGHSVVRAYPVQPDGAGYKAGIVNLLKGKDDWFRPSDVCTAPDGSVFIADWYDPAVGGHKFGDPERGRIYRVAPKGHRYKPASFPALTDFKSNLAKASEALRNPNLAVRYAAFEKLVAGGTASVPALEKLFSEKDARLRARVWWLLAKCSGNPALYAEKALNDPDPNLRCAGLRLAREAAKNQLVSFASKVAHDPDPQVRREAALSLRYVNSPEADACWAELAAGYDGQDRWYLEALGIGSDLQAESRFAAWRAKYPGALNTVAGRNLVWRSRSKAALPLLAGFLRDPQTGWADAQRYLRAFDFQPAPEKNEILAGLLNAAVPLRDSVNLAVLHQIDPVFARKTPAVSQVLAQLLPALKNTPDYLVLVKRLDPAGQTATILELALRHPDRGTREDAARWLKEKGQLNLLLQAFQRGNDSLKIALLSTFGQMPDARVFALFDRYLNDEKQAPALRRAALEGYCRSGEGKREVLQRIEAKHFPEGLKTAALVRLSDEWDTEIRQKARALLGNALGKEDKPLPVLAVLENRAGNAAAGHQVFARLCVLCHVAGVEGNNFGPALSEIGSKLAKNALYKSILYPSSGINFGYEGYTVSLKDGSEIQGIIESRTAQELTLRFAGGLKRAIPMSAVKTIREMSESMMTPNLYQQMTEQELVDLVEYLAGLKSAEDKAEND